MEYEAVDTAKAAELKEFIGEGSKGLSLSKLRARAKGMLRAVEGTTELDEYLTSEPEPSEVEHFREGVMTSDGPIDDLDEIDKPNTNVSGRSVKPKVLTAETEPSAPEDLERKKPKVKTAKKAPARPKAPAADDMLKAIEDAVARATGPLLAKVDAQAKSLRDLEMRPTGRLEDRFPLQISTHFLFMPSLVWDFDEELWDARNLKVYPWSRKLARRTYPEHMTKKGEAQLVPCAANGGMYFIMDRDAKRPLPFKTIYTNDNIETGKLNKTLILVDLNGNPVQHMAVSLPVGLPWNCIARPIPEKDQLVEALRLAQKK